MNRKLMGFAFLFVCSIVSAQQENKGVFSSPVMPGPNGVFIYTADTSGHMRRPSEAQSYTLYKEDRKGAGFKKLAVLSFPSSPEDLEKKLGPAVLQTILQRRRLKNVRDLYMQLKAGYLDTLGIYSNTTAVQEAMGVLYIDRKQTRFDVAVSYKLEVSSGGNTRPLYQVSLGSIRYTPLPIFKKYHSMVTDSVAMVTWYAAGIHIPLKADQPKAAFATLFSNAGTGTTNTFTAGARQFVYTKRDTLFVTYSTPTIPGSKILMFIRPEDLAGNRGPASDTIHLLALSFRNTISVGHLTAMDTLGSVWLKWDSLPAKAWCSGIQILKSRSAAAEYVVIDTLPVTATTYRDRRIISGNVYYYQLRPILFDLPQHGRVTPATVNVRTKKAGGKIAAPQGLALTLTTKSDIRLSWQPNSDLDIFAYYILRGTSPANMQVISPAIRDTVFIDSLKGLNAGITYLYSVAALNMDMAWSDTSAPIGIQSPRAKLLTAPGGIQARVTAQGIRLNWNDVSAADPAVTGYAIFRRKKGEAYFTTVNKTLLKGAYFTDSSVLAPGLYEYGCSSIDAWGHTSILSPVTEAVLHPLPPPSSFYLRNLTGGIGISIPAAVEGAGQGKYILYRRAITEKQYKKIGEISANDTYTDRAVMKDQLYAYAIAVQGAQTESVKSGEKSIRRK
jgi:hypothetical protein